MALDLLITNARTRANGRDLVSIGIADGRITGIGALDDEAQQTIDAGGALVTESFVNGHLHLCKVFTLERAGQAALATYHGEGMGGAMTAIEQAAAFKNDYDQAWILPNVRRAVDLALKHGNTHIRAFADVDTKARLEGVKALLTAREEYAGRVELQVVAFPQDGIARDEGAEDYVRQAMELGADVVGGIPWIEYTEADQADHIARMVALAKRYDKPISMLLDDVGDPNERTLEMLAVAALEHKMVGRVTAQHCRAMSRYEENHFRKVVALMKRAGIGLISDPHTGPLHARVPDLVAAGVNVGLGQDDIADAYYPFGANNMLEVAFLAVHLLWQTTFEGMEMVYDLVTTSAARALGMTGHILAPGGNADLVILDAEDVYHAIWEHRPPRHVIRAGVDVTP